MLVTSLTEPPRPCWFEFLLLVSWLHCASELGINWCKMISPLSRFKTFNSVMKVLVNAISVGVLLSWVVPLVSSCFEILQWLSPLNNDNWLTCTVQWGSQPLQVCMSVPPTMFMPRNENMSLLKFSAFEYVD